MSKIPDEARELGRIRNGFWLSRVLITANNFGLFDHLTKYCSAKTISKRLGTELRATEILLDALVGGGLLKKQKNMYINSRLSTRFLVRESPFYQGDIIRHADILWKKWSGLDETIKTGKPDSSTRDHRSFILAMHNIGSLVVKDVMKTINLKGVKSALDLGGGPGTYAMEMARKGVHVTLFDRPETIHIAEELIRKSGITGIRFLQGDFLVDDIGRGYDLVFISHILHIYSKRENMAILKKAKRSLNPHGRVVIRDFYMDENRVSPPQSALFSVNMLVNTEAGRCYTEKEFESWLFKTGFMNMTSKILSDTIIIRGSI